MTGEWTVPTALDERLDIAIHAAADALLAVCAVKTGLDPTRAVRAARVAVQDVAMRAEREARG
jgi:hypothetical protein